MKVCSKCRESKPFHDFSKSNRARDGRYPSCKECKRAADRAYASRPEIKARARERVKVWRDQNASKRDEYTKAYSEKNRAQIRIKDREAYHRTQAALLPLATNHGKEWTGPELEVISRDDLMAKEMAFMLGRTLAAVMHQRRLLNIDPRKDQLAGMSKEKS